MKCLMNTNSKFKTAVRVMSASLNEETKHVNKVIRHLYAARSEARKSKVVLNKLCELRQKYRVGKFPS